MQLARLFRLVVLLQSEPGLSARALAERCEVCRRTIYRDIDLLVASGIPVRYQKQEQGYRLAKGFFFQPPALTELEALALSVIVRSRDCVDGLGLLRHALEGVVKVVQGLSPEIRDRIIAVSGSPREGISWGVSSPQRREVREVLVDGLTRQRQIRLWYRASQTSREECTKFAIYRILVHDQHWFLVGRSSFHRRV
ncbi:MAG: helix-turn-helix transcriptional regulator, partial [Isosphaeraceae bacterium]